MGSACRAGSMRFDADQQFETVVIRVGQSTAAFAIIVMCGSSVIPDPALAET